MTSKKRLAARAHAKVNLDLRVLGFAAGLGITGLAWIRQSSADQSYDNGLYAAAAVLVSSAILLAFMPTYRYTAGAETLHAPQTPAPQHI